MTMTIININNIFFYSINQSMFLGDSSGPKAFQISFKRLWFTESLKKISIDINYKHIDFIENFFIFFSPVNIILIRMIQKLYRFHYPFIFDKAFDSSSNSSPLKEIHLLFPVF